jgi:hypothetical protein
VIVSGAHTLTCLVCSAPARIVIDGRDLCLGHGAIRSHAAAAVVHRRDGRHELADAHADEATLLCSLMLDSPGEAERLAARVLRAAM